MATVSPFAVRLTLRRAEEGIDAAGRTAGRFLRFPPLAQS